MILCDTVNFSGPFQQRSLFVGEDNTDMSTKNRRQRGRDPGPALPFDVTQDIDPGLAESLQRGDEPTLTQTDFDEIEVALPPPRKPRADK